MRKCASFVSLCLAAALLLSACDALQPGPPTAQAPATSQPRLSPLPPPTLAAVVATASVPTQAAPTRTAAARPTALPPTAPPPTTVPATVTSSQLQRPEAIVIILPSNNASVASPARVAGFADPTFEQNLVIQVTDAGGAVIATRPATIQGAAATRGSFDLQVPFVTGAGGPGRVSVFSTSPRDGGLVHLASVEVTLLSGGSAPISAGQAHFETHVILNPTTQATITGGVLHVSGFSDYVFESQLGLELCGAGGSGAPDAICGTADNVLATGTAALNAPDVGQPGPFAGNLTYHVGAAVPARLAVFSRSARDGGLLHLSTVALQLAP